MAYSYVYDAMGRMKEKTASGRRLLAVVYDRLTAYRYDPAGTEYTYNQMDYRVYVKDPLGNTTKYCFDRLCNLAQLIRPNQLNEKTGEGVGTKYLYDEMDEQIRRIDPLGNVSVTGTETVWKSSSFPARPGMRMTH